MIVNEIQAQKVKEEIQSKVKERVDKNQREYILREELKVIREELGDDNTMSDADEFQQAVDALKASKEVKEKLNKEIKRFRNSMNSPAEVGVTVLISKRCWRCLGIRHVKNTKTLHLQDRCWMRTIMVWKK